MTTVEAPERTLTELLVGIERQLARIADVVELMVAPPMAADPTAPAPPCEHPEDARDDFGLTNGVPDWQCRLCGHRTVTT